MRTRHVSLLLVAALSLGSCGSDDDSGGEATDPGTTDAVPELPSTDDPEPVDTAAAESSPAETAAGGEAATPDSGEVIDDAQEMADDLADDLEAQQEAVGGGSATLTVGDQEWVFEPVLCAIGEEQTGQEGAEFVLSSVQDGMQMYVSIDSFGHSVSLNDIEDFENPSVSLSSTGDGFVQLDGTQVTASAEFIDDVTGETVTGTFTATCP